MSCELNDNRRLTSIQQLRAVHEYARPPLADRGTFFAVDDLWEVARILLEDGQPVAWVGRDGPQGWPVVGRTPENCQYYWAYLRAQGLGYGEEAMAIARLCGMQNCDHAIAERGRHEQRVYPRIGQLGKACRARLILLRDRPKDAQASVPLSHIAAAVMASEYGAYRPVMAAFVDLLEEVSDGSGIGHRHLCAELERRVQTLGEILHAPIEPGAIWDLDRWSPFMHRLTEEQLEELVYNSFLLLEAIREDYSASVGSHGEAVRPRVALEPASGRNEPAVYFSRPFANMQPGKLASRLVVVNRGLIDVWRPLLLKWGLRELCWGTVLDQAVPRRGEGSLRWIEEAGRRLMLMGADVTQALLAREAGVDPATVSRHRLEIIERLQNWWLRPPSGSSSWIIPGKPVLQ